MNPLSASLLHSIWQGGLAWLVVFFLLRFIPARASNARYRLALGAVCLVTTAWFATWTLLEREVAQERKSELKRESPALNASGGIHADLQATVQPASVSSLSVSRTAFPWQSGLLMVWQAGVAIGFWRIATSVASARKFHREARLVKDPDWVMELDKVCAAYGTRMTIRLKTCHRVLSPVVVGIARPVILLPASLVTGVSPEVLRAALAHEVAHVVRWDLLINLLQMGTEALLFFNPFVWALNRTVRREREACCDAMASHFCSDPAVYAEALIWWTRNAGGEAVGAAMAISGDGKKSRSGLRDRVMRLLNPGHIPRTPAGWLGAGAVACLVALFFVAAGQGVRFAVKQLTAKERVEMIQRLAAPFMRQIGVYQNPSQERQEMRRFSGTIVDEMGKPVPRAVWRMLPVSNSTTARGETLADGRFEGELPNGLLRFYVTAEEFAFASEIFELTRSSENVSVVLKRGIVYAVRCVDTESRPIHGAEVAISYGWSISEQRSTTDADGLAHFKHQPERWFGELRISAPGYQTARIERFLVRSQTEPPQFALKRTAPFVLTVIDELDGTPLKDVTLRINEAWPNNAGLAWPKWNYTGLRTDAGGQATLDGLDPKVIYGMQAEASIRDETGASFRRGALFRISPGKENSLTLRLPRERRLKLKIINLDVPEKEITVQYGQRTSENGSDSARVTMPIAEGIAEVELRGLRPLPVDIYMLGLWSHSPELSAETTEFTIDYAKIKPPAKVKVVLNLDTGRGGAAPTGSFWLNWALPGKTEAWRGFDVPIKEGKAEFELPGTALFRLNNSTLLGGKIDEKAEYQATTDPTVLTIPVKPAGMIRVKVLEKNGELAQSVFVWGRRKGDSEWDRIEIKNGASPEDAREWYLSKPIEFGGRGYQVVASCWNRFVISQPVRINARNPVSDVILTLPEPRKYEILVVGEDGRPASGISLSTSIFKDGFERIAGDHSLQTDASGRVTLWVGGDEPGERFFLRPESGGYLRAETPVEFSSGKPVVLKNGKRVAGRILDKSTGAGIPGVRLNWTIDNSGVSSPELTTDQEGRFEFVDAPAQQVFLMVRYPHGKEIVGGHKSLYVMPGEDEAAIYFEDAPSQR